MYRRGLLSTVAFGGALAGCTDLVPSDGAPSDDGEPLDGGESPDDRAEIVGHGLVRYDAGTEEATVAIEGTIRINEPNLQHVELRGRFFDAEGEPLDTTFERLRELDVGTHPFEVQYPEIGSPTEAVEGYGIEITTIV